MSVLAAVSVTTSVNVDPATVGPSSFRVLDPSNNRLVGVYNVDGAGGTITFTPSPRLTSFTQYRVETTTALKTRDGKSFQAFASSFTTGTTDVPPAPVSFQRQAFDSLVAPTSMTVGPDGKLYVANGIGELRSYSLRSDGSPNGMAVVTRPLGAMTRTITGIAFDPGATATNLKLWVSHGALGYTNMPNFTGKVSLVSGAGLATVRDVIVGLPRSVTDHMNNGVAFGPDKRLYLAQGSLSGYGAPDQIWGFRDETPLSAAILVADVVGDSRFAGIVDVDTSKGYDPGGANAPVKLFATGVRNAFDLVWHSDGRLYAPVNESSSGNAPAGPGGNPRALTDLPAGRDFLARVDANRYYGHPDPSRGEYTLNGGNPTAGVDPFEVSQYPVGVQPDPNWRPPIWDFGTHRSPDGIAEYTSDAFGPTLRGKLLVVEFSGGDDLLAVTADSAGNATGTSQLVAGFDNPLDVAVDRRNGNVYVAEYGDQATGSGGAVTLLRPSS